MRALASRALRLPFVGPALCALRSWAALAAQRAVEGRYRRLSERDGGPGPSAGGRSPPLIVSLTSYGPRLRTLPLCVESLLRQSLRPDRILLWLADDVLDDELPRALRRQAARGVSIGRCTDIGPYKKIVPTLAEHPEAIIVTCDDDMIYPRAWLRELYESYRRAPRHVHSHRAHRMTYGPGHELEPYARWEYMSPGFAGPSLSLFATGGAGTLYPPGSLPPETLCADVFRSLCPTADDVWLKAMTALNGWQVQKVAPRSTDYPVILGSQVRALASVNYGPDGANDAQIHAVFTRYGIYRILGASAPGRSGGPPSRPMGPPETAPGPGRESAKRGMAEGVGQDDSVDESARAGAQGQPTDGRVKPAELQ